MNSLLTTSLFCWLSSCCLLLLLLPRICSVWVWDLLLWPITLQIFQFWASSGQTPILRMSPQKNGSKNCRFWGAHGNFWNPGE